MLWYEQTTWRLQQAGGAAQDKEGIPPEQPRLIFAGCGVLDAGRASEQHFLQYQLVSSLVAKLRDASRTGRHRARRADTGSPARAGSLVVALVRCLAPSSAEEREEDLHKGWSLSFHTLRM